MYLKGVELVGLKPEARGVGKKATEPPETKVAVAKVFEKKVDESSTK